MDNDKRCLVITEGTTRISKNLYKNSTCEEIIFPDTLLEIEAGAFQNCRSLQRLQLPGCIQKIGSEAFAGCTQLKELYLPYSVVEIGHNAFEHFQIIYCETKNPPEYWYDKADEEYYSEDYAMYLEADYELWYGDWGVRAFDDSDDDTGEDYIRQVLSRNPEIRIMWGRSARFICQTEQFIRFDIFSWMKEFCRHRLNSWHRECMGFNAPALHLRNYIKSRLRWVHKYPDKEEMSRLKAAFDFYDNIFCEVWNLPFHEEEFLFYRWEIYQYAMDWLKENEIKNDNLKQLLFNECEKRKQSLILYRTEWKDILN